MAETKKSSINLDDILKEQFGEATFAETEAKTFPVTLFGEEFKVLAGTPVANLQNIFNANDKGAASRFLLSLIHPDDRDRFTSTLEAHPALRGDDVEQSTKILMSIANLLLEVASGGRPTNSSSGSSRSIAKKAASKRSAAN